MEIYSETTESRWNRLAGVFVGSWKAAREAYCFPHLKEKNLTENSEYLKILFGGPPSETVD